MQQPQALKKGGTLANTCHYRAAGTSSSRPRLFSESGADAEVSGCGVDEALGGLGVARRESWASSPISLHSDG
jgi:hypothetical protein